VTAVPFEALPAKRHAAVDLPAIVQAARQAGAAFMVNTAAYLAEFTSRYQGTFVDPNSLENFALRAECHDLSRPGFGKPLLDDVLCPLSQHAHGKILDRNPLKSHNRKAEKVTKV